MVLRHLYFFIDNHADKKTKRCTRWANKIRLSWIITTELYYCLGDNNGGHFEHLNSNIPRIELPSQWCMTRTSLLIKIIIKGVALESRGLKYKISPSREMVSSKMDLPRRFLLKYFFWELLRADILKWTTQYNKYLCILSQIGDT